MMRSGEKHSEWATLYAEPNEEKLRFLREELMESEKEVARLKGKKIIRYKYKERPNQKNSVWTDIMLVCWMAEES